MEWPWWKSLPPVVRNGIAYILAFVTTVAAFQTVYPIMEPYLPAHRSMVREYTDGEISKLRRTVEPLKSGVIDLQISTLRARRSAIDDQIFTMEIEAPKSDNPDELLKRRNQIKKLKEEKDDLDEKLKSTLEQREKN